MPNLKIILDYKIVMILLTAMSFFIGLIVFEFFLLMCGKIDFYTFSLKVSTLSPLILLLGGITALIIPFVLNDINERRTIQDEINKLSIVITRLKQYFKLFLKEDIYDVFADKFMSFFISLSKTNPYLLIKIGIEVSENKDDKNAIYYTALIILDEYKLYINFQPFIEAKSEILKPTPEIFREILTKMKNHAKDQYKLILKDETFKFLENN